MEGKRSRWGGWPSKPERAVSRFLVGSTPTLFRQLEDGLTARLQDISHGPELGILSDRCGDLAVAVAVGYRNKLLGFRRAGERNRLGEGGRIGVADVVGGRVSSQAGIAFLVGFIDVRRAPAVASGIAARTEQQDEKDKSRSHAEPRLKRGRKAKSRLNCHFEANFNTCS